MQSASLSASAGFKLHQIKTSSLSLRGSQNIRNQKKKKERKKDLKIKFTKFILRSITKITDRSNLSYIHNRSLFDIQQAPY